MPKVILKLAAVSLMFPMDETALMQHSLNLSGRGGFLLISIQPYQVLGRKDLSLEESKGYTI